MPNQQLKKKKKPDGRASFTDKEHMYNVEMT